VPKNGRGGRKVPIRIDGAGATHDVVEYLVARGLPYSVGAWVAELTGPLDRTGWPKGMRVIVRKGRPHPGAHYPTLGCATAAGPGARTGSAARRATGLTDLHDFGANRIWCAIIALARDLTAWLQTLAPTRGWQEMLVKARRNGCAKRSPQHYPL
jgi:hypothetical protein